MRRPEDPSLQSNRAKEGINPSWKSMDEFLSELDAILENGGLKLLAFVKIGNPVNGIKQAIGRIGGSGLAKVIKILKIGIIGERKRDA
jgi:hypothetical protein